MSLSFGKKKGGAKGRKRMQMSTLGRNVSGGSDGSSTGAPADAKTEASSGLKPPPPSAQQRQAAQDIAKWSGRPGAAVASPTAPAAAPEAKKKKKPRIVCLLCKRQFKSEEVLRKHEAQSKLHKENLEKKRLAEAAGQQ
mmetsp:Transcript_42583/g.133489  ORF Transcript_42583/g.133489 Transcript_42583/m.133489 type:complete len:139 (+) Transcript_42583:853-1269(+)